MSIKTAGFSNIWDYNASGGRLGIKKCSNNTSSFITKETTKKFVR